jgi:hypothetical protein
VTRFSWGAALRTTAYILASALSLVGQAYADELANWLTVPNDTAALAIYMDEQPDELTLTVEDGSGEPIDVVDWKYVGLPLLRQYRVPPGQYRLEFEGVPGAILAEAKAGMASFIEVRTDDFGGFDVTLKSANFEPYKSSLAETIGTISAKIGYGEIEPRYFEPAKNALYFQIRGPGVKPPPE